MRNIADILKTSLSNYNYIKVLLAASLAPWNSCNVMQVNPKRADYPQDRNYIIKANTYGGLFELRLEKLYNIGFVLYAKCDGLATLKSLGKQRK